MKMENLFVRNIFLNLLTITFVTEADDILSLLLIGPKNRQRADEMVKKAIDEDLADKKITTIEVYFWPRVLALLPVMLSIISIYRQNKDLDLEFLKQDATCLDIVTFSLTFIGHLIPYVATLLDFVLSQYVKNGESINMKERFIAATGHIICMIYAHNFSYLAILSGIFFYEDSAKTYFQLDLNYQLTGWEFVGIASIIIIDCLWKRTSLSNTKTWLFYLAILLSLSLWAYYLYYLPTVYLYIFNTLNQE